MRIVGTLGISVHYANRSYTWNCCPSCESYLHSVSLRDSQGFSRDRSASLVRCIWRIPRTPMNSEDNILLAVTRDGVLSPSFFVRCANTQQAAATSLCTIRVGASLSFESARTFLSDALCSNYSSLERNLSFFFVVFPFATLRM